MQIKASISDKPLLVCPICGAIMKRIFILRVTLDLGEEWDLIWQCECKPTQEELERLNKAMNQAKA